MDFFFSGILFLSGLVIGRFLSMTVSYLEKEESDPSCRLKCVFHDCRSKLAGCFAGNEPWIHVGKILGENLSIGIITAIALVSLYSHVFPDAGSDAGDIFRFIFLSSIFSALIVIFIYDYRHSIIPDKVVFPAIGVSFILLIAETSLQSIGKLSFICGHLGAAVLASGFFLFLIWITRGEGMGGGDVKLGFLMGMVLGISHTLLALFLAFFSGAIAGLALITLQKKGMKSAMPFGPFLIFGFMVSFFLGDAIIDWYWGTLLC